MDKKNYSMGLIFRPDKYPGPIAIPCTPSKECDEYHKNSCIQINVNDKYFIKKVSDV